MINSKKSLFKKKTQAYTKDSIFEIIDIEEAIRKSNVIKKCPIEKFIYSKNLRKTEKKEIVMSCNIDELNFESENGKLTKFTENYQVIEIMGNGTFGIVLSAFDKSNKYHKVAIKVLANYYQIIPKYKFRNIEEFIKKEVQIQSQAKHHHLAKLYCAKENSNFIFLIMELLEGGTLKEFLIERYNDNNDYLLLEEECSSIIKGIFEGLNHLHSLNIIHRDIKPGMIINNIENIMLYKKGCLNSIKICDFGLSTNLDDSDSRKCGTLIYMAPELILQQSYNESIDSWACGFVLYILCSGGMHPIYKNDHDYDQYEESLKSVQTWDFPEKFPMYLKL